MRVAPSLIRPGPAALGRRAAALRDAAAELSIDLYDARLRLADPAAAGGALGPIAGRIDRVLDAYDDLARAAGRPTRYRRAPVAPAE